MPYQLLADIVLLAHFAVVLFVVFGLPVIIIGNSQRWTWVNNPWWRLPHLAAIVTIVLQAWLGRYCFLTSWESNLRIKAGQEGYESTFVEHWIQALLFFEAPLWVFACLYTAFGGLVAWAYWRYPPRARRHATFTSEA